MRTSTLTLISLLPFLSSALGSTKSCKPKSSSSSLSSTIGVAAVATTGAGGIVPDVSAPVVPSVPVVAPSDSGVPGNPTVSTGAPGTDATASGSIPGAVGSSAVVPSAVSSGATGSSATGEALYDSAGYYSGPPIIDPSNITADPNGWKENYGVVANPADPTVSYGSHPELKLSTPEKDDCGCGYKVSSLGDIWMPYKFEFNFSTIGEAGPFSGENDLEQYGWRINVGHHAGGPSANGTKWNGTALIPDPDTPIYQCLGDPSSLSVKDGNLELTMRGGQTPSDQLQCPELIHNNASMYGIFQADIQWSDVPGTCQAFWMNHTVADQYADELDIEVLGGAITTTLPKQQNPGLWSTNWEPMGNPHAPLILDHTTGDGINKLPTPFPQGEDPTKTFNTYTIAWVPGKYSPRYYNGKEVNSPAIYNANHTMEATLNNWSNNAEGWSGLVPQQNSTMKVRSVLFYYRTKEVQVLPEGCDPADVCPV